MSSAREGHARRIRSLLWVPANRSDLAAKATRTEADAIALDLEDGTPPADRLAARAALAAVVASIRGERLLFVRVNAPGTEDLEADLRTVAKLPLDGVIVPKIETAAEAAKIRERLPTGLPLVMGLETAAGVLRASEILGSSGTLACYFGAEDFITDVGGRRTAGNTEVLFARSAVVLAARVAGVLALDQVVLDFQDEDAFRRDAEQGRDLGYAGKMCIHPRQVAVAKEVFTPSAADVARSQRLLDAYEAALAVGNGTVRFEGQMVDTPLVRRAQAVLAAAGVTGTSDRSPTAR